MTSVPIQIAVIRKKLELNQAEFAKRIGVGASTVSNWETGKYKPNQEAVIKLLAMANEVDRLEK